jgi:hypothetical protein
LTALSSIHRSLSTATASAIVHLAYHHAVIDQSAYAHDGFVIVHRRPHAVTLSSIHRHPFGVSRVKRHTRRDGCHRPSDTPATACSFDPTNLARTGGECDVL